jgi:hypothetical protein
MASSPTEYVPLRVECVVNVGIGGMFFWQADITEWLARQYRHASAETCRLQSAHRSCCFKKRREAASKGYPEEQRTICRLFYIMAIESFTSLL